jgi:tetratricopeptide (TPR) repeat protein
MTKAFRPRPARPRGGPTSGRSPGRSALARELVDEIRRTSHPAKADRAIGALERSIELLRRGDAKGAGKEAEEAKALAPRSGAVREALGLAYYGQGRWRDAIREVQAYRRMTGRLDQNHIIADSYRGLGQPERALPVAMDALRAQGIPEEVRAEALVVAASALADQGRFDDALGLLRRHRTREGMGRPHDLRVWYVTGDVLARAGRREEAVAEFRKVLRFDAAAFDTAERLAQLG